MGSLVDYKQQQPGCQTSINQCNIDVIWKCTTAGVLAVWITIQQEPAVNRCIEWGMNGIWYNHNKWDILVDCFTVNGSMYHRGKLVLNFHKIGVSLGCEPLYSSAGKDIYRTKPWNCPVSAVDCSMRMGWGWGGVKHDFLNLYLPAGSNQSQNHKPMLMMEVARGVNHFCRHTGKQGLRT